MQETELFLSQLEHFAFSVCLVRRSFKELPVFTERGGGEATPTCTKLRSSLCLRTEEGGRVMWGEKGDASGVIMASALKGAGASSDPTKLQSQSQFASRVSALALCLPLKAAVTRSKRVSTTDLIANCTPRSREHGPHVRQ